MTAVGPGLTDPEFTRSARSSSPPASTSAIERARTDVVMSSTRLRMLMCARPVRWWFGGLAPARAEQLERLQRRFDEYRETLATAQSAGAVTRVLWRRHERPAFAERLSFERALQLLGRRLVRIASVLEEHATGYVLPGASLRVRRFQPDFDAEG